MKPHETKAWVTFVALLGIVYAFAWAACTPAQRAAVTHAADKACAAEQSPNAERVHGCVAYADDFCAGACNTETYSIVMAQCLANAQADAGR